MNRTFFPTDADRAATTNLMDAIDGAVNPALLAKRRKANADKRHAESEAIRTALSPGRSFYEVILPRFDLKHYDGLFPILTNYFAEWKDAYNAALAHTHVEARAASPTCF